MRVASRPGLRACGTTSQRRRYDGIVLVSVIAVALARLDRYRAARSVEQKIEGSLGLDSAEVAKIIADVAVDKKAADVVILDIRSQSVIADYFVICTGNNPRQIQAIAGAVEDKLDELHIAAKGFEGAAENGWMLLDCGDVIVHIFGPLERDFYRLERLWSAAPTVVYLQ